MKRSIVLAMGLIVVIAMIFSAPGCRKLKIEEATTDDVNIVGYLDKHLDSFSLFRQILNRKFSVSECVWSLYGFCANKQWYKKLSHKYRCSVS